MEPIHVNSGRQARILLMSIQRKHVSEWPQKLKRRRALCKTLPCKHCDKGLGEQGQQIVGLGVHLMWITASFNVDVRLITIYKKLQGLHVILDCCSNLPLRQQSQLQMSQPQANTCERQIQCFQNCTNKKLTKVAKAWRDPSSLVGFPREPECPLLSQGCPNKPDSWTQSGCCCYLLVSVVVAARVSHKPDKGN